MNSEPQSLSEHLHVHEHSHLPEQEACGVTCNHNHATEHVDHTHDHHEHHEDGSHPEGCGCVEHAQAAREVDRGEICDHTGDCGHLHHHEAAAHVDKHEPTKAEQQHHKPEHESKHEHVHGPGCGHVEHELAAKFIDTTESSTAEDTQHTSFIKNELEQEVANQILISNELESNNNSELSDGPAQQVITADKVATRTVEQVEQNADTIAEEQIASEATKISQSESSEVRVVPSEIDHENEIDDREHQTHIPTEETLDVVAAKSTRTNDEPTSAVDEIPSSETTFSLHEASATTTPIMKVVEDYSDAAEEAQPMVELIESETSLPDTYSEEEKSIYAQTVPEQLSTEINPPTEAFLDAAFAQNIPEAAITTMIEDIPDHMIEPILEAFQVESIEELEMIIEPNTLRAFIALPEARQTEILREIEALDLRGSTHLRERLLEAITAGLMQNHHSLMTQSSQTNSTSRTLSNIVSIILKLTLRPSF